MAGNPTVLFSPFRSSTDPLRVAWTNFRELVHNALDQANKASESKRTPGGFANIGGTGRPAGNVANVTPALPPTNQPSGFWRLLAPNHREIARSSYIYGTFLGARAHVLNLRENTAAMVIVTVHGPTAGTHGWYITVEGKPVMTCTRWYETTHASLDAAEGARAAFPVAFVSSESRPIVSSGPTRRANAGEHGPTEW
jgi:hypothetical protein